MADAGPVIADEVLAKWQKIVDTMARLLSVPAGLIMRITGEEIEVFLASRTEGNPYEPGARERLVGSGLYCETVIRSGRKLLVPDALADEAWRHNPDVKLGMVAYLGLPIRYPDGTPFGTICALDDRENHFSETYADLLASFREIVEGDLALLVLNRELGEENRRLNDYIREIRTLRGLLPICSNCSKIRDDAGYWRELEEYVEAHSEARFTHWLCEECVEDLYGDEPWYGTRNR